jgi:hypothetical protein
MLYAVVMPSCGMIFIPSFKKIDTGVQTKLRFCLNSLNGYNVGTTEMEEIYELRR